MDQTDIVALATLDRFSSALSLFLAMYISHIDIGTPSGFLYSCAPMSIATFASAASLAAAAVGSFSLESQSQAINLRSRESAVIDFLMACDLHVQQELHHLPIHFHRCLVKSQKIKGGLDDNKHVEK